jgi:hypothetical protein
MTISKYSTLATKIKYLANIIESEADSDSLQCYINSYTNDADKKRIQFGTLGETHIWCEIAPIDEDDGVLLESPISVNLYDLYNTLQYIRDDTISMLIDHESNELVIGSYYVPDKGYEELEVRLACTILEANDLPKTMVHESDILGHFEVNAMLASSVNPISQVLGATQVSVDFSEDTFNLGTEVEHFSILMSPKADVSNVVADGESTLHIEIPSALFMLMTSTGDINPVKFNVCANGDIYCKTLDYGLITKDCLGRNDSIVIDECTKDGIVMFTKDAAVTLESLGSINKPNTNQRILVEKVQPTVADFTVSIDNRLNASVRGDCSADMEEEFTTSLTAIRAIYQIANCDALKIKYDGNDNCSCVFENGWSTGISKFNADYVG